MLNMQLTNIVVSLVKKKGGGVIFDLLTFHLFHALSLIGQKMCICHLPCRQLRPSLGADQVTRSDSTVCFPEPSITRTR